MINNKNMKPNILVIGDLIIDKYLWGSSDRISPEAPVPVVNIHNASKVLGGAGNVINNITHKHITNVNNSYIRTSADKLVVIKGLDDYIVIDEDDVLLIYPKKEEQNIKQVNGNIKDLFGDKYL